MGTIAAPFVVDSIPRNGATAQLYAASAFTTAPVKNTALPASPLQTVTTGTANGGDGMYRFDKVAPGKYYVGISWNSLIAYDSYSVSGATVRDYGAVGDGLTDDTAAFQAALNDTNLNELLIPPGVYSCGNLTITGKSQLTIRGTGGQIAWSGTAGAGNQIGFQIVTSCNNIEFNGIYCVGDNIAADGHCLVWCNDGVTVVNLRVIDCRLLTCTRGVKLSALASGSLETVLIQGNYFKDTIGTAANQGEAIFIAEGSGNPAGIKIIGNTFINSRVYDLHVSQVKGLVILGNTSKDHRLNGNSGVRTPAFRLNRAQDVTAIGNLIEGHYDGGVEVTCTSGVATKNILISRNQFIGAVIGAGRVADITIGTATPATDGFPEEIRIDGNLFSKTDGVDFVGTNCGKRLQIINNQGINLSVTTSPNMFYLGGAQEAGGALYTDEVVYAHNQTYGTISAGALNGFPLDTGIAGGTGRVEYRGNRASGAATFSAGTVTNPNIVVFGQAVDGLTFGTTVQPLQLQGGNLLKRRTLRNITANGNVAATDDVVTVDTSGGQVTATLPTAVGIRGTEYVVYRATATANNAVVATTGGQTINGAATKTLGAQYSLVVVCSDGANWIIAGQAGTVT